ncbi:MAG: Fe-S cluster assembly scaffold protein NifU [Firmicutes bacterium]|nr:Fe-S cluster assembly scaffold protein NifU [Bacillota bacterium]
MYSDKVMDHFRNPRNVGEITEPDGVGMAGNPVCGDMMELFINVDEEERIEEIKFRTFGCGAAIAVSSILTEMVVGLKIEEALKIDNKQIADELGGLPPVKMHCSMLGREALEKAVEDYRKKKMATAGV